MIQTCFACGSHHLEPKFLCVADYEYGTYHPVDYLICKRCGLLIQYPFPARRVIPSFYPSEYRNYLQGATGGLYSRLKNIQEWWLAGKIERFLFGDKEAHILEIGCGSGMVLLSLSQKGFIHLWGTDMSDASANALSQKSILFKRADIEKKFPYTRRFEIIILNQVLEHLLDPKSVLAACRNHLSNRGKIIIITPNSKSFALEVFRKYCNGINAPRHVFIFSFRSIEIMRKKLGFDKLSFYPELDPMQWSLSLQNLFQNIFFLRTKLKKGLAWYTIFFGVLFIPISLLTWFGKKSASMMCVLE